VLNLIYMCKHMKTLEKWKNAGGYTWYMAFVCFIFGRDSKSYAILSEQSGDKDHWLAKKIETAIFKTHYPFMHREDTFVNARTNQYKL